MKIDAAWINNNNKRLWKQVQFTCVVCSYIRAIMIANDANVTQMQTVFVCFPTYDLIRHFCKLN